VRHCRRDGLSANLRPLGRKSSSTCRLPTKTQSPIWHFPVQKGQSCGPWETSFGRQGLCLYYTVENSTSHIGHRGGFGEVLGPTVEIHQHALHAPCTSATPSHQGGFGEVLGLTVEIHQHALHAPCTSPTPSGRWTIMGNRKVSPH
jgi:hypothetical protein